MKIADDVMREAFVKLVRAAERGKLGLIQVTDNKTGAETWAIGSYDEDAAGIPASFEGIALLVLPSENLQERFTPTKDADIILQKVVFEDEANVKH